MVGGALWLLGPPSGVSHTAWQLFSIFVATIVGIVIKPLAMGAVALIGLTATALTRTLTPAEALSGFGDPTVWLIVSAFFIARGFIATGLGTRIAYLFVASLGRKTLGLAYGLIATDLVMAPAIPSNTARSGGVVYPIVAALASSLGSYPDPGTARRAGAFLILTAYQGAMITSAMFLTGTTGNLVAVRLAAEQGITVSWTTWAVAAAPPGVLSLVLVPLLIYRMYPPSIRDSPDAPGWAQSKMAAMGPLRPSEWTMGGVFLLMLSLWISGGQLAMIDAPTVALVGLCVLVLSGVLTWSDILTERGAWDTLVWFAALIAIANHLSRLGLTSWFSQAVSSALPATGWTSALLVLALVYFYSHYLFASSTAHATAMYGAFLATALALGAPPILAALLLGYFNGLMGGTTHYGGGPAPVFFGSGYVPVSHWWLVGAAVSLLNISIWLLVGGLWWRFLGYW